MTFILDVPIAPDKSQAPFSLAAMAAILDEPVPVSFDRPMTFAEIVAEWWNDEGEL